MRIILMTLFALATTCCLSQSAIVRIQLLSSQDQLPISGATVQCKDCAQNGVSDSNGMITLPALKVGKTTFDVAHNSFQPARINVACCKDTSMQIFYLQPIEVETLVLREVMIEGTTAVAKDPVTFSEIKPREIRNLSNGQDMPQLLRFTPSLISTSDAGNGIGYTGLWIRGSDQSRINVSINGIPLNDPESQQVFWVNTPDLGSSANNIQIQRGIGTSVNGSASFGGSIQIDTRGLSATPFAETNHSYGSFNSMRNNIAFGTGIIADHFAFEGRLSRISSDGYIDRASSELKSFFLEGNYLSDKTLVRLTLFGGAEVTYQSWAGTPAELLGGNRDSILAFAARNGYSEAQTNNLLNSGRTYNFYEYENQVDNYQQDHAQLHIRHVAGPFTINAAANYTHGRGYFEELRYAEGYEEYGLAPVMIDTTTLIESSDLIRQRWLRNHFFGGTASANFTYGKLETTLGMAMHQYLGDHFGEIIWMQYAGPYGKDLQYYRGESNKTDGNIYLRTNIDITNKIRTYTDIQYRQVAYTTAGKDNDQKLYDVNRTMRFFNPKAGITYAISGQKNIYVSVAYAGKEPNRNDFIDAQDVEKVKPEYMTDIEAGYRMQSKIFRAAINGYYMIYRDQLVLTGELNDVGAPLRTNVASSFRRGIELEFATQSTEGIFFSGNATLSENKITAFEETLYDYTNGFDVTTIQHNNTDISFSPRISGGALLGYKIKHRTLEHAIDFALYSKYVGKQYLDNTQNDYMSIDPYFVQDFRITAQLQGKKQIELNFWINNLFDLDYSANGYTYSYIFEQRVTERFYYPQAGRNYTVGLSIRI